MANESKREQLAIAQRKEAQGRGLKNSEIRLLSDHARGRDHFAEIVTAPVSYRLPAAQYRGEDFDRGTLQQGRDTLQPGLVGPRGPQGDDGAQGATGATGSEGDQGPQGDQGEVGMTGTGGAQGPPGPQGAPGSNGSNGTQGAQGSAGAQGPQGYQGDQGYQGAAGGGGDAVDAVGTDGKLNAVVKHSSWATPSAYPTELRAVDGGVTNKLNSSGAEFAHTDFKFTFVPSTGILTITRLSNSKTITLSAASLANNITIDADGIKVLNASSGNYAKISEAGVITVYDSSGAKTLTIDPEAVTQNMSVKTWDVCNSGTPASALVLASDPF